MEYMAYKGGMPPSVVPYDYWGRIYCDSVVNRFVLAGMTVRISRHDRSIENPVGTGPSGTLRLGDADLPPVYSFWVDQSLAAVSAWALVHSTSNNQNPTKYLNLLEDEETDNIVKFEHPDVELERRLHPDGYPDSGGNDPGRSQGRGQSGDATGGGCDLHQNAQPPVARNPRGSVYTAKTIPRVDVQSEGLEFVRSYLGRHIGRAVTEKEGSAT